MPPLDAESFRWFVDELQPHAHALRAWLQNQFPDLQDPDDVVQEAMLRVIEAHRRTPIRSAKAYLFAAARNLVLMGSRSSRARCTRSLEEIDASRIQDDSADVRESVARTQELEILTLAIQSLPTRCRQVITLRKIYGLSQQETAAELGIAEHTVEIHTAVGLKKINRYFRAHRQTPPVP
jgi:RNA polymerase sigma factor (sigma-70 family)